jgi:prevent-host-death family protein
MTTKTIPATRFKAECLALLDRVEATGETLTVTKWGRPVAQLVAMKRKKSQSQIGTVIELGDIMAPIGDPWELE